jgi:hypothetical protein
MAVLLLLIGVAFLGATYAGEVSRAAIRKHHADEIPRTTPQMMAPDRKPPINSNGSVYAIGSVNHVSEGW